MRDSGRRIYLITMTARIEVFSHQMNTIHPLNKLYMHAGMFLSSLITEDGRIFASQDERFHHYFGRDTMLTALFIYEAYQHMPTPENAKLLEKSRKAVRDFWKLQRLDGKIPHEAKLFADNQTDPLYLRDFYDKVGDYLINNDSVDATPLTLIATATFLNDKDIDSLLGRINLALDWMLNNIDEHFGWLSYYPDSTGLTCQGWMDSQWGVTDSQGNIPDGPIALVEVQAYAWKALRMWADIFATRDHNRSQYLLDRARDLQESFNKEFVIDVPTKEGMKKYLAHAIDGQGQKITSISINPGLVLWAAYHGEHFVLESYIPDIISILMSDQMYHPEGGIRTFAQSEPIYDPEAYHSGKNVFWPFASAMVAHGMLNAGEMYHEEARKIMMANLRSLARWNMFIEHSMIFDDGTHALNPPGFNSNSNNQTWTVAAFWWMIHHPVIFDHIAQVPSKEDGTQPTREEFFASISVEE